MATIVTRAGKGSPLTNTELDSNFTNLNSEKQDALISGTNIKTINGNSILGSGNLSISSGSAAAERTRTAITATAGQTTFTVNYTVGFTDVFLNGALLTASEYTATSGTSIILAAGATAGDLIEVISYSPFSIITPASASADGYLTSSDWSNFNTAYSWGNHAVAGYAVYPSQTGQAGKVLKTDGTVVSWGDASTVGTLDDLTDVVLSSPANGQYLKYNGTSWVNDGPASVTRTRTAFTATAGQTSFTVSYTPGYLDVFSNGVLLNAADYTATNGTSVVLATAAALNDIIEVIAYSLFDVATPAKYIPVTTRAGSSVQVAASNGFIQILTFGGSTTNVPTY